MGASQSNQGGKPSQQTSQEVKTSYYELLGVERQATDEELKKAYRRKALELHPDRNYGDEERATTLFSEIRSAYEVLSDPQERAWYDSHEDAILRDVDLDAGDSPEAYERNIGLTTADDITRMLRKFHGGVEFTDVPSGFFGFLRETFDTLAREEEVAARRGDGIADVDYPSFGHMEDEYEDVVKPFYAVWNSFATKKTFAWRDKYRTSDAPDRRTRRYIEKENQNFRQEGIREFNDAVRTLVAFVRKRDPRYKPNTQSELDREKVLREGAAARAAKMRAAHTAKLDAEVLPEWAKFRETDELQESTDEESEEEQFECVACRKTFKSEKQFEAHEKSKKHVKNVQALRKQLQKEGRALALDDDGDGASGLATPVSEDTEKAQTHLHGKDAASNDVNDDSDSVQGHWEQPSMEAPQPTVQNLVLNDHGDVSGSETPEPSHSAVPETEPDPDASMRPQNPADSSIQQLEDVDSDEPTSQTENMPKMGKAAQKRAKRAAAAAATQADQAQHKCATCYATFPSKSRLFQHITDHGHAAPVPAVKAKGGARGRK